MRYTKICYQLMIFLQIRLKEINHGKTKRATLQKRNVIFVFKNEM